jgi:hypothetical protein
MASNFFRKAFMKASGSSQFIKMNPVKLGMWAFPAAVGATWFIWPALDQEWLIELGLAKEPDLHIKAVQAAKDARMALKKKNKPAEPDEEEEEEPEEEAEEEAPEEEVADEPEPEAEEEGSGGDEEEAAADAGGDEDGGDEEEEEEDEEEEGALPKFKPLLEKKEGKSLEEVWDVSLLNFSLIVFAVLYLISHLLFVIHLHSHLLLELHAQEYPGGRR